MRKKPSASPPPALKGGYAVEGKRGEAEFWVSRSPSPFGQESVGISATVRSIPPISLKAARFGRARSSGSFNTTDALIGIRHVPTLCARSFRELSIL